MLMAADKVPELGRDRGAAEHGDIVPYQIVERREAQPPDVRGAHEEDPLVPGEGLARKMTVAGALLVVEGREDAVALAAEHQLRRARPGELLEGDLLLHRREDASEHLGAESGRGGVGQILVGHPLIGHQLQWRRSRRGRGDSREDDQSCRNQNEHRSAPICTTGRHVARPCARIEWCAPRPCDTETTCRRARIA